MLKTDRTRKVLQFKRMLARRGEMTRREIIKEFNIRSDSDFSEFILAATKNFLLYETDEKPSLFGLMRL